MNEDRLNSMLRDLDPADAAEIREFAQRDTDEKIVYLFREMKGLKKSKPLTDRLYDMGYVGALLAYVLFDNKGNIPGIK